MKEGHTMNQAISFNEINIKDEFWLLKLSHLKKGLIRACLDKCYESGRIDNFKKAAKLIPGEFQGMYYNDSDVYKILEGAAYYLQLTPDEQLEEEIDQIISYIAAAQEEDGYLDTYFTLVEPENKWTNMERHEMYCGGHLIEAAIAYFKATNKPELLNVAIRMVDHYLTIFGPGKKNWVEGHEEIELALVKLFEQTQKKEYLELSKWLLSQRGKGLGEGTIWETAVWGPAYCQDDVEVIHVEKAVGHAVRATYLYTAMAEIYKLTSDQDYLTPLISVAEDIRTTKLYITGGIGSSSENEGFTEAYDLPNESAYCETCAAIGNIFFYHQMNLITGEAKYAEIIERALYNNVLSGVSMDGNKFFYVNPLASVGDHHRSEWFDTSCCPTNLARFLPSVGNYIYAVNQEALLVNQYIGSEIVEGEQKVVLTSGFPYSGEITVSLTNARYKKLKLRKPDWCKRWTLTVDGEEIVGEIDRKGYLVVELPNVETQCKVSVAFEMSVNSVKSNPKVENNSNKVTIMRGPLVYCAEQLDNKQLRYDQLYLESGYNYRLVKKEELNCISIQLIQKNKLNLIPYFTWDNREAGFMKVWLDNKESNVLYKVN